MSTPMLDQFHALKAENPEAILFYRMGDFYETFFEDAVIAARVLELTLTSRNKNDPDPVPMAGVPYHAAGSYVQRMVEAGYCVAIAEQMEDPALAKGLVRRAVVRVVTPGLGWDPTTLDARTSSWVAGLVRKGTQYGIALLDASTGDLRLCTVGTSEVAQAELLRHEPKEVLLGPGVDAAVAEAVRAWARRTGALESQAEVGSWDPAEARRALERQLGVSDLAGFGVQRDEAGVAAAGAVLRYARRRLGNRLENVHVLRVWRPGHTLGLDDATRLNLELVRPVRGEGKSRTLLGVLDRTATAMGGRLLREWLLAPLLDPAGIQFRQDAIEGLVDRSDVRQSAAVGLRHVADIERLVARVTQGTAGPRDLAMLRRSLDALPELRATLAPLPGVARLLPADLAADTLNDLKTWLVDDPPVTIGEGGLVRPGANAELDELVSLATEGKGLMAALEARERDATGITSLRVRHHQVFGYFLEVTRAHLHRVPRAWIRKQTLSNAERFFTPELKELEEKVTGADVRRVELEIELFGALRERVAHASPKLTQLARAVAAIDVFVALAAVADEGRWCRPRIVDEPILEVVGGRHPVVEAALDERQFVPNDVSLREDRRLIVLTGPNMAGKSTILRQTALHVVLAQMGSFVPAERATLGVFDRVFCRVGASDDLAQGQSTFMVEMAETASILHHATQRSLVVLDEIGRGTATYDGLAIAWSVAEDLLDRVGAKTLFATHYHELCALAEERAGVVNQRVAVSVSGDTILFLRQLQDGGASRSYGIQCARLAGLPTQVVRRAAQLLERFEAHAPRNDRNQLSLFGAAPLPGPAADPEPAVDLLREALDGIDPDALTPREALEALYRLRGLR